eukprot:g49788.t1
MSSRDRDEGGGGGRDGGRKRYAKGDRNKSRGPISIDGLKMDDNSALSDAARQWREENSINTAGGCPPPYLSFEEAGSLIPPPVFQQIRQAGFTRPSLIQAQAWPAVQARRDVVGVAKTGSGKTLGFLMPCFQYCMSRAHHLNLRNGPVVLVLAPTRELASQIEVEAQKFGKHAGINSTCVYGGAPQGPQLRALRGGVHVVIATPGRLNDFLERAACNVGQVAYLVMDEADRMLDMGFEPQIRKIIAQ